jgi:ATP-dependent phosphofructokinase / diphosphate-dependent phosphofructokinase
MMRIGILTGGGDCPGLNAAISGLARCLFESQNVELFGIEDGFLGLYDARVQPIRAQNCLGLIQQAGTLLGTCNRFSPLQSTSDKALDKVLETYHALKLDAIVALGGDGTQSLCHELSHHGMNFIGIPKTIDNDIAHADRSFGFDSAVSIVSESIDRLHSTARSHHRVMIVETMGRYAGWIALYGGMAGDADVILLPEFPYHLDEVVRAIKRKAQQRSYSILVVAEGAHAYQEETVKKMNLADSPDPIRLGGVGYLLQQQLEKTLGLEVRTTVLGHVQRGGSPTAFDRIFANNLGVYAAKQVLMRHYNGMVSVHRNQLGFVPLSQVAHQSRKVTKEDMTLYSAVHCGVSLGIPNAHKWHFSNDAVLR